MVQVVVAIGYLVIVFCLAALIAPKIFRRTIDFVSIGSRLYLVGLFRLALGILLLIVACRVRFWGYIVILGLVLATSGLSIFFFALRRTKKLLARLQHQSNLTLRLYALIGLAIWIILIYSLLASPVFLLR